MEREKCLNHAEFTLKYNLQIDFLTYHAITRTIGKYIEQNILKTTAVKINNQPPIDIILRCKKGTSSIYKTLLDNNFEIKGRDKWFNLIGLENAEWLNSFIFLKRTTNDTKLRWLQFRIIHHTLTTNRSVSKFKVNQSHLCSFCGKHSETIQHLFWTCDIVQKFWKDFCYLINTRCKHSHNFNVNEKLILFGKSELVCTDNVSDLIILLAKLFIYRCKVQGKNLILRMFKQYIYNRYCIEKYLARNSPEFKTRWDPYLEIIKGLF